TSEISDGEIVKGGTDLKYTLKETNTGSRSAENVVATIIIPNGVSYVPEENVAEGSYAQGLDEEGNTVLKLNLGTIEALSSVEKVITLKTSVTALVENNIEIQATVTADNTNSLTTNKITNTLAKTYFITQVSTSVEEHNYMMEGDTYLYTLTLKSSDAYSFETNEQITRENTIVTVTLPEELTYDSITLLQYSSELKDYEDISSTATVTTNGKTVTVNIGSLDGGRGKTLTIASKIGELPEGVYQKEVTTTATIQADNTDVEIIEDVTDTINKPGLAITQTCNIPEGTTITAGEEFTYTFTIENLSDTLLSNVIFTDYLPEGLQFKSAELTYPDGTVSKSKNVDENGNPTVEIYLTQKQIITISIKVSTKSMETDTRITNKASVANEYVESVESNSISHTIKKFVNTDIDIDPGTGEEIKTRKIIGTIWYDTNKDGIKDADEGKASGVTVLLLDNNTGDIAIDATGATSTTKTASDGTYMFNNLLEGSYTVIFLYDSANYSATTYQKANVDEAKNSDAIDKNIVYKGVSTIAGVTEEIVILEENKYDIDLGLVENPKFDLKLDKVVSKITVNNSKGTEKYEYYKNFAKVDFDSKYVESATMIIEYKITITNEGAIPGYVKKIADYLPEEVKFTTELNTDWYEGKDGTI
ncbi:MAG: SdrD B-like domain-containing protein, partial [Clostridia bacterium]